MNMQRRTAFGLWHIVIVVGSLAAAPLCPAQKAKRGVTPPAGVEAVRASAADGLELARWIKVVESPPARAYLYLQVAAWLAEDVEEDPAARQAALDVAAAGVSEIHEHEGQIPPPAAFNLYDRLLKLVGRHSPEEAARLREKYPLKLNTNLTDEAAAGRSLHAVLAGFGDSPAAPDVARAAQLILSGRVPVMALLGELIRLDQARSPALRQMLDATLSLEERRTGALPPLNLMFLLPLYLKETTPPDLQARFLAVAVKATQLNPVELKSDPAQFSGAVGLLQRSLPLMQRLTPSLYAAAAAQLAALTAGQARDNPVYENIKNSSDPLAQTMLEAERAGDRRLKEELLESAARLAKQQGKLRLAADLITSSEEDRSGLPEGYSGQDEFLDGLLEAALQQKDPDTARYVLAKVRLPVNRAGALRKVGRYFIKAKDTLPAFEALGEAAKALAEAPEGREKVIAYLDLTSDYADVDYTRAAEAARAAVKAANKIPRPREDDEGRFTWSLFPVMESTTKTFRALARKDQAAALSMAGEFDRNEFRIAANLGVYDAGGRPLALTDHGGRGQHPADQTEPADAPDDREARTATPQGRRAGAALYGAGDERRARRGEIRAPGRSAS
ncbi:MAG TPA: hypothetical protein VF668_05210 [Pyrinomonadaceae bacterium]|jgi:hypothetical protein